MTDLKKYGFLHSLGIYGWEEIEDIVLASLLLRGPILLVGKHGTAKTYFAESIAGALGLTYQSYDASKGMFEDIIGFPDIKNNRVNYISSPITIWDKEVILVDEISRAVPEMQNKWLEIIRSRKVMGLKLKSLKYIVAAMNPPGYLGVVGLDMALAERFAFTIKVPDIVDMDDKAKENVIKIQTMADIMGKKIGRKIKKNEKLIEFLAEKEKVMHKLKNTSMDKSIIEFLKKFILAGKNGKFSHFINGRRQSMMRKSVLAYLAVMGIKSSEFKIETLMERLIPFITPWYALNSDDISKPLKYVMNKIIYNWLVDEHNPYKNCDSIDCLYERFLKGDYEIFPIIVENLKSSIFEEDELKTEPLEEFAYMLRILIRIVKDIPNFAHKVPVSTLDELKEIFLIISSKLTKKWYNKWDGKHIPSMYQIFSYYFYFENKKERKNFVNFIK